MTETSTKDPVYNIQEYRRKHAQFLSGVGLWIRKSILETGSDFQVFYEPSLDLISKLTLDPPVDVEFFVYEFGPGTPTSRGDPIGHLIVAITGETCLLCHYWIKPSYTNLTLQRLMLAIGSLAHWAEEEDAPERPILIYCRPQDNILRRKLERLGFRDPRIGEILIEDVEVQRRIGTQHRIPERPVDHWRDMLFIFDRQRMKATVEPLLDPIFAIDRRYPIYFAGEVYDTEICLEGIYALEDPISLHKRYQEL